MVEAPGIEAEHRSSPSVARSIQTVAENTSPIATPDDRARRSDPESPDRGPGVDVAAADTALRDAVKAAVDAGDTARAMALRKVLEATPKLAPVLSLAKSKRR